MISTSKQVTLIPWHQHQSKKSPPLKSTPWPFKGQHSIKGLHPRANKNLILTSNLQGR
jgi:hypothetical protein